MLVNAIENGFVKILNFDFVLEIRSEMSEFWPLSTEKLKLTVASRVRPTEKS